MQRAFDKEEAWNSLSGNKKGLRNFVSLFCYQVARPGIEPGTS